MADERKAKDLTEAELAELLATKRAARFRGSSFYEAELDNEVQKHRDGLLRSQRMFDEASQTEGNAHKPCPKCNQLIRVTRKKVARTVTSVDGAAILRRNYHYCGSCKLGFFPLDAQLDLPDAGTTSALVTKFILDLGLHSTFEGAAQRFALHHGAAISENMVRLVVERAGRAATSDAFLAHRLRPPAVTVPALLLVAVDGSMLPTRGHDAWRETKLGMVVRAEHRSEGKARALISEARFVARMTGVATFAHDLTRLLSLEQAWACPTVAFLGDGAPWIWNMAQQICPNAVQIVDFMHAMGAAAKAVETLFIDDKIMLKVWTDTVAKYLKAGRVHDLVAQLEQCAFATRGRLRTAFATAAKYFNTNATRMRYDVFLRAGLPIGSGMIESAHRHVLQARMKLAGQHWDPVRADRLAQLRAAQATCGPAKIYDAIFPRQAA